MSCTILGIDPSLTNTGLCWGDGEIEHKTARVKSKPIGVDAKNIVNRIRRIDNLLDDLEDVLEGINYTPVIDLVVVESYSFGSRVGGEYLGEYGGALRMKIMEECRDIIEVAPSAVKKFATGKGNSKKEVIIGHVQKRWGVLFENSDEADAYVLYRIGLCYAGICEPENAAQREVLAKLKG